MEIVHLSKPDRTLRGHISLDGSKSLSNRALIILALAGADPEHWLRHVSTSKDTLTLRRLLSQEDAVYDAGDAGTTFRFLTACLAARPGEQILTGSKRMRERPVGGLVQALRTLGADIQYLEKEGYPPLRIGEPGLTRGTGRRIVVDAGVSSQFLSALLMIGPYLPEGLELVPEGRLVSRPYLEMTIRMMRWFGAVVDWVGDTVVVQPGAYQPRPLTIEADWSAASYWYALAAFAEEADLTLEGLYSGSWQGDAVVKDMMDVFGVETVFNDPFAAGQDLPIGHHPWNNGSTADEKTTDFQPGMSNARMARDYEGGIWLRKRSGSLPSVFRWNFLECPDIAQTLAVVCGGLGVPGEFTGLETLAIKETDRTAALRQELTKTGVSFGPAPDKATFHISGKSAWKPDSAPRFATYGDHRMAMAFAPLAMFGTVEIENPAVVAKSYPQFWEHLEKVGFHLFKMEGL